MADFPRVAGFPGNISRPHEVRIEQAFPKAASVIKYGDAVEFVTVNGVERIQPLTDVTKFAGIVGASHFCNLGGGVSNVAPEGRAASLVTGGFVQVAVPTGTPVRGGKVFVKTADGTYSVGPAGTGLVELPNAQWAVTGKCAANIAEVRLF